ncbi:MAG: OmpA family protein [Alphaproteobacteria bacterium]
MKINWRTISILAISSTMLAGCAVSSLPDIKSQTPPGGEYEANLHSGYVELAEMEAAETDWSDAETFTLRARSVLEGNNPAPEEIAARDLPADMVGTLTDARVRLVQALSDGGAQKAPEAAALAQVMFDCWMQEQEENIQPADIAACRSDFELWMRTLEAALEPVVAAAPEPEPEPASEPAALPGAMIVFFDFDSASISEVEQITVTEAVRAFRESGASSLALTGHTDKSGANDYNVALSKKRVDAVADALRARGIADSAIKIAASGESKPAIDTADGVKERLNRRVVINFE